MKTHQGYHMFGHENINAWFNDDGALIAVREITHHKPSKVPPRLADAIDHCKRQFEAERHGAAQAVE